jgi:tRNA-splicing ligase RtcB (3'-phosphate/5'-hydroxy nucleic acid ligase)
VDLARFTCVDPTTWRVEPHGAMRVPAIIYADENLIRDMDDKVFEQAVNVATLPGIVQASYAMPDAHWGYGFPIGGVAAFDPDRGGIVSAGGVGFDISCGVRTMLTGLSVADTFRINKDDIVVTIHCGSRGLGHQIGTEFLKEMVVTAAASGIELPDRELACAPINSEVGQRYLGAMRAAINCALANREILGHYARRIFAHFFPNCDLRLLFDVSHNTCKVELHVVDGRPRELFVHRKGATRAFGPAHVSLPAALRDVGQPVLIGGSMGTGSYILVGEANSEAKAFSSACHGAGRALSRHAALRQWSGRKIVDELAAAGILIRSPSTRGVAEEAPGAYKDVSAVVAAAEHAGLARRVARLRPMICIKG